MEHVTEAGRPAVAVNGDHASEVDDDLIELEFTPMPPQDVAELDNRVYLLGSFHPSRPI